jgi:hypothetical protein
MPHSAPSVMLLWSIMGTMELTFLLHHLWRYDRFAVSIYFSRALRLRLYGHTVDRPDGPPSNRPSHQERPQLTKNPLSLVHPMELWKTTRRLQTYHDLFIPTERPALDSIRNDNGLHQIPRRLYGSYGPSTRRHPKTLSALAQKLSTFGFTRSNLF